MSVLSLFGPWQARSRQGRSWTPVLIFAAKWLSDAVTAVPWRRRNRCLNCLPHTDPVHLDPLHGADADTLLDPRESNPDFVPYPPPNEDGLVAPPPSHFSQSGDGRHRNAVWRAFHRLNVPGARITAYQDCGTRPWVAQTNDDDGKYVVCSNRCHDRFCPGCSRLKASVIAENTHRWIKDRQVRFLTLTLKGGAQPLHQQLARLYDSFRKLRQTRLWSRSVRGGAAFLEVKIGKNSGMWHPHIHAIIEGKFIAIRELKKTWERITQGSHQVDLQFIRSKENAARYVSKYVSKPFSHDSVKDADQLDELLHTLSGTHAALTFGTWRGLKLTKRIDDRQYNYLMSVDELKRRVAANERYALEIWNELATAYGKFDRILPVPQDSQPNAPPKRDSDPKLFADEHAHWDR